MPKAGGRQDEASTPEEGLGARLQQLLTPSRRPHLSCPPSELPPDLPPSARRSPMDSLLAPGAPWILHPRVATKGRLQTLQHWEAWGGAANLQCPEVGLEGWLSQLPG